MNFDSYIISETKTSLSMPLAYPPPPRKLKHSKGFKYFKGFTLAETLITLTIIGVVAALTVPNLLNKYTKHTYVVGLKKAYSQLQNAMKMIPITEGCSAGDFDCAGMFQGFQYINGQYVNIPVTNIDGMDFEGAGGSKFIYLLSKQIKHQKIELYNGKYTNFSGAMSAKLLANDGIAYGVHYYYTPTRITIDINGEKGPNKAGRDIFQFYIVSPGEQVYCISNECLSSTTHGYMLPIGTIIPAGSQLFSYITSTSVNHWQTQCINHVNLNTNSAEDLELPLLCTGKVLEEDAMNY